MERASSAAIGTAGQAQPAKYTFPLTIVTALFFMWGLLTSLNDILIPHLKSVYNLTYVQAMLVNLAFFSGYFLLSIPAGALIRRTGYKAGAVIGLAVCAVGAALFYPAATSGYGLFLFALFVLAGGITVLQVAANPYVTVLGPPATASSRLNLTQALNSFGTFVGPPIGGYLILSHISAAADPNNMSAAEKLAQAHAVQGPYLGLAATLAVLAILFAVIRLPIIKDEDAGVASGSIFSQKRLMLGVLAIFVYVGAEVSIGSFLINYMGDKSIAGFAPELAANYVAYYWGGAMVGRFIGSAVMRTISPGKVLAFNAAACILLLVATTFGHGHFAMWAVLLVGLFNSIMFPTIFSMSVHELGPLTSQGSGLLVMAIAGGAVVPVIQAQAADVIGLQTSFLIPAVCYAYILYFGARYARMFVEVKAV
ncbi:sugar MFS transporter [Massilia sp. 9096]|uniref:sugar MFS transporter n=1 Tax=Massilia sp. 9096 TaxID=1500894 RepID=UPI00055E473A|nr:sugar MFS transporter [Massilia sp. 9096]